jgi:Recombinase
MRRADSWGCSDVLPVIQAIKAEGNSSLREIAAALNERGITTARGGEWSAVQVKRILDSAF